MPGVEEQCSSFISPVSSGVNKRSDNFEHNLSFWGMFEKDLKREQHLPVKYI